jgi:hypothetical protein
MIDCVSTWLAVVAISSVTREDVEQNLQVLDTWLAVVAISFAANKLVDQSCKYSICIVGTCWACRPDWNMTNIHQHSNLQKQIY